MTDSGPSPARWTWLLLAVVTLAGLVVRLIPVALADFPVNDGGLFVAMTRGIRDAGWGLPDTVVWNGTLALGNADSTFAAALDSLEVKKSQLTLDATIDLDPTRPGPERVIAGGRPICPLCGSPIEPEGHMCPKSNGHAH